jgi:Lrp/AsnC family transcriptional regulator, regulator for asnA, asnC and gidA
MKQLFTGPEANLAEKVDALDYKILCLLQEDSRSSFSKIAAKAGVSVGTAYNRIKKLEAQKLVKGYTVLVDSAKLGYELTAVIFVQADGEHLPNVTKEIAKATNVVAIYNVTGEFDAAVIAKFKDRGELSSFIKKLASTSHIKRTITNVSLNTVKEDFRVNFI